MGGSLLDTPKELLVRAAAVVMEVCLPKEAQRQACSMLQTCSTGCRVVCYAPLHDILDESEACRLAPVRLASPSSDSSERLPEHGDGAGGLALPASWNPMGHGFAFYELAATSQDAAALWATLAASGEAERIKLDATGNPGIGRTLRYTDAAFADPVAKLSWAQGDKVKVGCSWLPFPDLGEPDDECDATGFGQIVWTDAWVVSVAEDGFTTLCDDKGIVEEKVHPERIRVPGKKRERADWTCVFESEDDS